MKASTLYHLDSKAPTNKSTRLLPREADRYSLICLSNPSPSMLRVPEESRVVILFFTGRRYRPTSSRLGYPGHWREPPGGLKGCIDLISRVPSRRDQLRCYNFYYYLHSSHAKRVQELARVLKVGNGEQYFSDFLYPWPECFISFAFQAPTLHQFRNCRIHTPLRCLI